MDLLRRVKKSVTHPESRNSVNPSAGMIVSEFVEKIASGVIASQTLLIVHASLSRKFAMEKIMIVIQYLIMVLIVSEEVLLIAQLPVGLLEGKFVVKIALMENAALTLRFAEIPVMMTAMHLQLNRRV